MFDLSALNPVKRFFYDNKEIEWVDLRQVTEAKYKEFRKQLGIKQRKEIKHNKLGNPVYVQDSSLDEEKLSELVDLANDYTIADWHLLTNENEEIECTFEIKKKMLSECPPFASWIEKCMKELKGNEEEIEEETSKN